MKKVFFSFLNSYCSKTIVFEINLNTNTILFYKNKELLNLGEKLSLKDLRSKIKSKDLHKFNNILENKKEDHCTFKLEDLNNNKLKIKASFIYFEKDNSFIGSFKIKKINNSKPIEVHNNSIRILEKHKIPTLIVKANQKKILFANKSARKLYMYKLEEFKNIEIDSLNILEGKEFKKSKKNQKSYIYEKHTRKDGRSIDVEIYKGSFYYENEMYFYYSIIDISKRKNAEYKLKQAHTIYQNTQEGIFVSDLKGKILSVNKAFENITGYKKYEIINKKISVLKSNKHSKSFYKKLWETLYNDGIWQGEIINKTKKGKLFHQWLTITTVYDINRTPKNFIAVFSDFSKLKEQEQLLREKDQIMHQQSKMAAMGEMLRNIAHQWRQPLSVITSSASGLKMKKEFGLLEDNDFDEFANGILKSSQYLSDTIEDFSNYFKNNQAKELFSIKDTLDKTNQLIEASLKDVGIELTINMEDDLQINGVKNELIQVLLNIINNSKDAFNDKRNLEKKYIHIYTNQVMNNLIIYIKDNAGGIKDNILNKIFEPYFTTKHQFQGTGIGLYMSKEIIEEHLGGNIHAQNHNDGNSKGACFIINIPLKEI